MSRRTVIVSIKFRAILDDDHDGIPAFRPDEVILGAARTLRGCAETLANGTVEIGLDRASSAALRKKDRGPR